jgi:hypothetical protein
MNDLTLFARIFIYTYFTLGLIIASLLVYVAVIGYAG